MSDDYKINVDADRPATLNNGAGVLTDCATLRDAVMAWRRLNASNRQVDRRPGLFGARDRATSLRTEAALTPRRFSPPWIVEEMTSLRLFPRLVRPEGGELCQ
jgi:hypothetical protein